MMRSEWDWPLGPPVVDLDNLTPGAVFGVDGGFAGVTALWPSSTTKSGTDFPQLHTTRHVLHTYHAARHAPCDVLYLVPMPVGC